MVYEVTGKTSLMALLLGINAIPTILFQPIAGVIVSYKKKKNVLFNSNFNENPDYLNSLFGFKMDSDAVLNIYPSMINFKSIDITYNEEKISAIPSRYTCYFGYKFKELITLTDGKKNESELLQDKLKCLGDKSKYEILKMLKDGPMYGQQIAEKLSLTTATISYHINSLVLCGLVKLNKVDNKIYYNTNKDEINSFLKKLGEELI